MKFSDYKGDDKRSAEPRQGDKKGGGKTKISDENKKLMVELLRQYGGKSKQELMQAIILQAEKSRREGKLSDAELDAFASMLYPSLDAKGKKELDEVISRIKKI